MTYIRNLLEKTSRNIAEISNYFGVEVHSPAPRGQSQKSAIRKRKSNKPVETPKPGPSRQRAALTT
jgi:hypothetical protein